MKVGSIELCIEFGIVLMLKYSTNFEIYSGIYDGVGIRRPLSLAFHAQNAMDSIFT